LPAEYLQEMSAEWDEKTVAQGSWASKVSIK